MQIRSFILAIFISVIGQSAWAQRLFVEELGEFEYKPSDIEAYYQEQNINYFKLKDSFVNADYKINFENQFQIKDWFSYDWFTQQTHFDFNVDKFIPHYNANTFNQAKKNYYSELSFSRKKMYHEQQITFFKEWGGLNHPPQHKKLIDLPKYSKHYAPINYNHIESLYFNEEFNREIDKMSQSELSFNNQIEILEDKLSYERKLKLIKEAKESILMSSLVFVCDESTYPLTQELIKKAKQGIPVYVIVDKFISTVLFHNKCPRMMQKNGVKIIRANDFFKHEGNAIYHNKKLITDLKDGIIGGQNMLNADNFSHGTDFRNRDIDVHVKGPLVTDMAHGFVKDYEYFLAKRKYSKKRKIYSIAKIKAQIEKKRNEEVMNASRGKEHYNEILNDPTKRMQGVCRYIQQSPYEDRTRIGRVYLKYLEQVKTYLAIQTPQMLDGKYTRFRDKPLIEKFDEFEMYNKLHDRIQELGQSINIDLITSGANVAGNEVVDMLNDKIRKKLDDGKTRNANRKSKQKVFWNNYYGKPHFKNLVKYYAPVENIDVWNHISFMHSKIFYFDRIVASIGSYNLHHNATDHAYENTIICQDQKLNNDLDEVMVRDMVNSIPFVFKELN